MNIIQLLQLAIERKASDLHITAGNFPCLRIDGVLYYMSSLQTLSAKDTELLILSLLTPEQKTMLFTNREIDLGYEFESNRFRINVFFARNSINASFRLIPTRIKTIDELEMPPSLHNFVNLKSGLVLVTGPTGQGKSTTIASVIEEINKQYAKHIITIEDPIEFVYSKAKSIISQRELHQDTHSWNVALRSVLREDPDVVFVGEIRDHESAQHVLTIAETGHLVFSTLHTISAPETINRLIDIFPPHQQNQIKSQLASVLRSVISQRLLPKVGGGRVAALEILYNNSAVSNIIREGKPYLLDNIIQTSESEGFILFEKYLRNLLAEGKITRETALAFAIRPKEIEKILT